MFGWLSPKCPVSVFEKTWTETHLQWLADQFGIDRLMNAQVVLPTEQFFPEEFQGTYDNVRLWMDLLCGYLEINPLNLELEILDDEQMPDAAGHYDATDPARKPVVRIAQSTLDDPQSLLATLAHELSHELLLGGGLLSPEDPNHEWVTDLLPVFFGLGIFAANSTVYHYHVNDGAAAHHLEIGKQGYLPSHMLGYAMALFCWVRDEYRPEWTEHLRLDAESSLKQGLRYLRKTNDSVFHANYLGQNRSTPTPQEILRQLQTGSPSFRMFALWEIRSMEDRAPETVELVVACLRNRDAQIRAEATYTLASLNAADDLVVPSLVSCLKDSNEGVRAAAATALGMLRGGSTVTIEEVAGLLGDEYPEVVQAACRALRQYGADAAAASKRVLLTLEHALIDCHFDMIRLVVETLCNITPDPRAAIDQFYEERDPEIYQQAVQSLSDFQQPVKDETIP